MITQRKYTIDPKTHWRKYAPKGHENDFDQLAEKYKLRQSFGEAVTEAIEAETQLNKAIRTVLRMRTIAKMRLIIRAARFQASRKAMHEVLTARYGRCLQWGRTKNEEFQLLENQAYTS